MEPAVVIGNVASVIYVFALTEPKTLFIPVPPLRDHVPI